MLSGTGEALEREDAIKFDTGLFGETAFFPLLTTARGEKEDEETFTIFTPPDIDLSIVEEDDVTIVFPVGPMGVTMIADVCVTGINGFCVFNKLCGCLACKKESRRLNMLICSVFQNSCIMQK